MSNTKFESDPARDTHTAGFAERVLANQKKLTPELKPHYDFIVCGSGSSGSVVARRLAENADVSVLLLEASGSDDMPSIKEDGQWPLNIGSEYDWAGNTMAACVIIGERAGEILKISNGILNPAVAVD